MHRSRRVVAAAVVGVLVLAAAGAAIATTRPGPAPERDRAAERDDFLADVAARLDVTPEQLRDAFRDAALARVDRLVAEGAITEEQADRIRSRIDAGAPLAGGPGPWFGGPGPALRGRGGLHRGAKLEGAAEYLELSRDELRQALRDGTSLADLARQRGKSVDGLKQALLAPLRARLDRAEAAGRLTAEEKQERLDRLSARLDRLVERSGGWPRRHGQRRR